MRRILMAGLAVAAFAAAAADSTSYVRSGLILQFDGVENAGAGQPHAAAPTVWKDLVGSRDLALPSGVTAGEDSMLFAKVSASLVGMTELSGTDTDFTLEVVCRTDGDYELNTSVSTIVSNPRIALFFRDISADVRLIGSWYYSGGNRYFQSLPKRYSNYSDLAFVRDVHTYSIRQGESSGTMAIDGGLDFSMAASFYNDAKVLSDKLTIGNTKCNLRIQSIRLYNRKLSRGEATANAAVDRKRFASALPVDADGETSVFSDAVYWLRAQKQADGSAASNGGPMMANALRIGAAATPWDNPTYQYGGANIKVETLDIPYPYLGRTVRNRSVLHFNQTTGASTIAQEIPANVTNKASYTVFMRFKVEERMKAGTEFYILRLGDLWTGQCGIGLRLNGSDDDNLWLRAYHGSNADDFKGMQSKDAAYHLMIGKWIDLAITVNGRTNRLYFKTEDGLLHEESQDADVSMTQTVNYSLQLGGSDGAWSAGDATKNNFKGWVHQVAVWNRTLSKDEVLAAFCGDEKEGDAFRLGVPNDSCEEFAGTGDADLTDRQDWRNAAKSLDKSGASVNVKFDLPDANRVYFTRLFKIKSTSASQDGATVSVALNGADVTESLSVGRGLTAAVSVKPTLFKPTGNVLTVTRTDSGAKKLEIDCMSLTEDVTSADPQVKPVADDVYADAIRWYRDVVDRDGDGSLFAANADGTPTYDFPEAFHAARPGHAANRWAKGANANVPATNFQVVRTAVKCPATGVTLENENCVRFVSATTTNASGKILGTFAEIQTQIPPVTNSVGHSGFFRFRFDGYMNPTNRLAELGSVGYDWTNSRGVGIQIKGPEDGFYLAAHCGRSGLDFALPAGANPLKVGEWVDLVYTISNCWCRLYVQSETSPFHAFAAQNGGSGASGSGTTSTTLHLGAANNASAYQSESYSGFRGLVHQVAVWQRVLSEEEVRQAMAWPKPDLFRLGAANGKSEEFVGNGDAFTVLDNAAFAGAKPVIAASGDTYTVKFDVSADEAAKNQILRFAATADSVPAVLSLSLNGQEPFFYDVDYKEVRNLSIVPGGIAEFGVSSEFLKEGENTLVLKRIDNEDGILGLDAVSLGNCGRCVKVRTKMPFFLIIR